MESCIFEKVENSIATKLCADLLDNHKPFWVIFSTQHNAMTKFYRGLFKCENKLKIG